MSRSTKPAKPYIVVFCEGESEQAYTDFLRKEFKDVAFSKCSTDIVLVTAKMRAYPFSKCPHLSSVKNFAHHYT